MRLCALIRAALMGPQRQRIAAQRGAQLGWPGRSGVVGGLVINIVAGALRLQVAPRCNWQKEPSFFRRPLGGAEGTEWFSFKHPRFWIAQKLLEKVSFFG